MPRKKKSATEMTTDELMRDLFPKKVRDKAKEVAEKSRKTEKKRLISEVYMRRHAASSI
jgi:hypothetical protein